MYQRPDDLIDLATSACLAWPQICANPEPFMLRENAVFRVQTSHGPCALRLHRPDYHSRQSLQSELDWMAILAQGGIEMPAPIATAQGSYLHQAQRNMSMLTWVSGQHLGDPDGPFMTGDSAKRIDIFYKIGAQMAQLHLLSDAWEYPAGFSRPSWGRDGLVGETPFWGRFWQAKALAPDDRRLFTAFRDFAAQILDDRAEADIGLIHADLVRENVLIDGPVIRFIDFDDCGFGYRGFDIATALIRNDAEPDRDDLEQALLDGYASIRALPDLEILGLLKALRSLSYIGWLNDRPDLAPAMTRFNYYVDHAKRQIARYFPQFSAVKKVP